MTVRRIQVRWETAARSGRMPGACASIGARGPVRARIARGASSRRVNAESECEQDGASPASEEIRE
jgi:hypothetical protein